MKNLWVAKVVFLAGILSPWTAFSVMLETKESGNKSEVQYEIQNPSLGDWNALFSLVGKNKQTKLAKDPVTFKQHLQDLKEFQSFYENLLANPNLLRNASKRKEFLVVYTVFA